MTLPAAAGGGTRYARRVGSRALACLVAVLALAPGAARAQERLSLRWEAPAACPDRAAVQGEVTRLLGGSIPSEGAAIAADAHALEVEGGFELTLRTEVEGALGERALTGHRCDELAAAAALILALMIDPEAVARAEPSLAAGSAPTSLPAGVPSEHSLAERLEAPTLALPREPVPREPEPPARRAAPDEGLRALLGVGALLDVGTLPAPTPGVLVEGGLGIPLIDARLRAVFLFAQPAQNRTELPGASAELMALSIGVVSCLRPIDVARFLGVCAEVAGGAAFGSSSGISAPAFGAGFWLAAGGGLTLAWQPEPWFDLEAMAEALGQIVAPPFDIVIAERGMTRTVTLFAPPGISGRFGVSARVHF